MGVWIETPHYTMLIMSILVTPCMGVWIETYRSISILRALSVTPCMGVWIETEKGMITKSMTKVTPCMGVWIETLPISSQKTNSLPSHPVWVCGLKLLKIRGI